MRGDIGRIFVGVHGSVSSLAALRHAVAEARARNTVVHSVLAWTPPGGDVVDRRVPEGHLRRIWTDIARDRLRAAWNDAMGGLPDDVPVVPRVERGAPGRVLTQLADRPDDLLVIGSGSGGNRLRRFVRRGVARQCLARAGCAVLVVPEPSMAREFGRGGRRWAVDDLLRNG